MKYNILYKPCQKFVNTSKSGQKILTNCMVINTLKSKQTHKDNTHL